MEFVILWCKFFLTYLTKCAFFINLICFFICFAVVLLIVLFAYLYLTEENIVRFDETFRLMWKLDNRVVGSVSEIPYCFLWNAEVGFRTRQQCIGCDSTAIVWIKPYLKLNFYLQSLYAFKVNMTQILIILFMQKKRNSFLLSV